MRNILRTPDSVLINGLGRFVGSTSDLAVISVTQGKRYRFRLVNLSCLTYFTVSLDGHNFTVIEADGNEHQPLVVDSLTIFAGQRYSIIVEANQTIDNYCEYFLRNRLFPLRNADDYLSGFRADPFPTITNFTSSSTF